MNNKTLSEEEKKNKEYIEGMKAARTREYLEITWQIIHPALVIIGLLSLLGFLFGFSPWD